MTISIRQTATAFAAAIVTSLVFVVVVLGVLARMHGLSLYRVLRYFREELLVVLGTSSSEPVRAFKARHASTLLTFDAVVDAIERARAQQSQAAG